MKITIQFCALQIYTRTGGMERFNRRIVDSLDGRNRIDGQERATVHILGDRPEQVPASGSDIILKGFSGQRIVFFLESLIFAIRKSDVLIIGHINLLPLAFLAKLLRPSLKTLLFVHGVEVWDSHEFRSKRFFEPLMLRKSVDRVAAVSRYTACALCENFQFPQSRISILPNAVDPTTIADAVELKSSPNLLTVSRLSAGERQKNVDKIVYALAALKSRYPTLTLEIVGEGALLNDLKALTARLDLKERVRFLGKISEADLNAAYQRASIFVLPSTKEGFGIVYLEAWQHGLAIIAAKAGATPEVVQNEVDGLLVDLQEPNELVEAIERLVREVDLRQRMAFAGRRKVEEKYLQKHFFANFNEIVSEVMSDPQLKL
jgi:phosphatidylinositol alpha-1,6-mannosyltransferase